MQQIKKVAVLGAGVMGATIAAHLANAGTQVLLLDMIPKEFTPEEKAMGNSDGGVETRNSLAFRNRLALQGLKSAIQGQAFYHVDYVQQVETGNFADDISKIRDCDWVVEVVVENMAIKKRLLQEQILPNLGEDAILSSNTSGLSVNEMAQLLPSEVRRRFLVTHFFNPPRYMHLLELIPCRETDPAIVEYMSSFCSSRLGKGIVHGKDTPNFIANRIGVYGIFNGIKHMIELDLTVEEVDAVAGPMTARAGSAIFRTCDLVGLDTLAHVCRNSYELLVNDEERNIYLAPDFFTGMLEKGLLGQKTKKGFFKREKVNDQNVLLYYDYKTGDYQPTVKPRYQSIITAQKAGNGAERIRTLIAGSDKAAIFAWQNLRDILLYAVKRIPEVADDIVNIDNGLKWGFSWELGPFEMLDAIGVESFVQRVEADGLDVPESLRGVTCFYKHETEKSFAYDPVSRDYREIVANEGEINLNILRRAGKVVIANPDASLFDLGDGVFCLEFHSKMNAIGNGTLEMIEQAVEYAEAHGVGLVIGNQGRAFSAGANLSQMAEYIGRGDFDAIDAMINRFQRALMRVKYSHVPTVSAPFGMTLGGGCEVALQSDAIVAHAETFMGLVEIGVGLLPAGGGTKEMAVRAIEAAGKTGDDECPAIMRAFQNIIRATVSGSAADLTELGYLRHGDSITMNIDRLIGDAKKKVLALASNYRPSAPLVGLEAPGRNVASALKKWLRNMHYDGVFTQYEVELGEVIADVITGGDLIGGSPITEQYLLDLERGAFLALCCNPKTLQRIEHMMQTGKPLRN